MTKIIFLIQFISLVILIPQVALSGECKEHIELYSAAYLSKEYGKNEMWVLNNVKINLWEKPSHKGKGRKVGQMLPGSRAVILESSADDYKVKSPLDKSVGWINKIQVKNKLYQDTETRKPCSLK